MGKNKVKQAVQQISQGQLSIKSFFKKETPLKKQESTQNASDTSQTDKKQDLANLSDNNSQQSTKKLQESYSQLQQTNDKIEQTQESNVQTSKRAKLQKNGMRAQQKMQNKQAQKNKQSLNNINGEGQGIIEVGEEMILDDILKDENSKQGIEKNSSIVGSQQQQVQLFEEDEAFVSDGENQKEKILDQSMEDEDLYQKVLQMTDDEKEQDEQQDTAHKKKQKKKKEKKQNLDDSFNLEAENSDESESGDESYDDGSDFSSQIYQSRRKGNGGKRRSPVDLTSEPQQRKMRKIILSEKEIKNLKYPYEVANNIYLISPGAISTQKNYHSRYNFFPIGYKCSRVYPSCKYVGEKTTYFSEILEGKKGKPLFKVTAEDDKSFVVQCESSSQCWKQIAEAAKKLNTGTKKVSISGPEMFGLQNQLVQQILEKLENSENCINYYANFQRNQQTQSDKNEFESNEENEENQQNCSEDNQQNNSDNFDSSSSNDQN